MSDTVPSLSKICKHCQQLKLLTEFRRNGRGSPIECKECNSKQNHEKYLLKKLQDKTSRTSPFVDEQHTRCRNCKQILPITSFRKDASKVRGYATICKQCYSKVETERKKIHPKSQRCPRWSKMHFSGGERISNEIYDAMFAAQGGLCASCGLPETKRSKKTQMIRHLAVDHNHQTGKIRGLLCSDCNMALGLLRDRPERVEGLSLYIRKHTS